MCGSAGRCQYSSSTSSRKFHFETSKFPMHHDQCIEPEGERATGGANAERSTRHSIVRDKMRYKQQYLLMPTKITRSVRVGSARTRHTTAVLACSNNNVYTTPIYSSTAIQGRLGVETACLVFVEGGYTENSRRGGLNCETVILKRL